MKKISLLNILKIITIISILTTTFGSIPNNITSYTVNREEKQAEATRTYNFSHKSQVDSESCKITDILNLKQDFVEGIIGFSHGSSYFFWDNSDQFGNFSEENVQDVGPYIYNCLTPGRYYLRFSLVKNTDKGKPLPLESKDIKYEPATKENYYVDVFSEDILETDVLDAIENNISYLSSDDQKLQVYYQNPGVHDINVKYITGKFGSGGAVSFQNVLDSFNEHLYILGLTKAKYIQNVKKIENKKIEYRGAPIKHGVEYTYYTRFAGGDKNQNQVKVRWLEGLEALAYDTILTYGSEHSNIFNYLVDTSNRENAIAKLLRYDKLSLKNNKNKSLFKKIQDAGEVTEEIRNEYKEILKEKIKADYDEIGNNVVFLDKDFEFKNGKILGEQMINMSSDDIQEIADKNYDDIVKYLLDKNKVSSSKLKSGEYGILVEPLLRVDSYTASGPLIKNKNEGPCIGIQNCKVEVSYNEYRENYHMVIIGTSADLTLIKDGAPYKVGLYSEITFEPSNFTTNFTTNLLYLNKNFTCDTYDVMDEIVKSGTDQTNIGGYNFKDTLYTTCFTSETLLESNNLGFPPSHRLATSHKDSMKGSTLKSGYLSSLKDFRYTDNNDYYNFGGNKADNAIRDSVTFIDYYKDKTIFPNTKKEDEYIKNLNGKLNESYMESLKNKFGKYYGISYLDYVFKSNKYDYGYNDYAYQNYSEIYGSGKYLLAGIMPVSNNDNRSYTFVGFEELNSNLQTPTERYASIPRGGVNAIFGNFCGYSPLDGRHIRGPAWELNNSNKSCVNLPRSRVNAIKFFYNLKRLGGVYEEFYDKLANGIKDTLGKTESIHGINQSLKYEAISVEELNKAYGYGVNILAPNLAGGNYIFRIIDTTNPFPGASGKNTRERGSNWSDEIVVEKYITNANDSYGSKGKAKYSIMLTPSDIKEIKNNGYTYGDDIGASEFINFLSTSNKLSHNLATAD